MRTAFVLLRGRRRIGRLRGFFCSRVLDGFRVCDDGRLLAAAQQLARDRARSADSEREADESDRDGGENVGTLRARGDSIRRRDVIECARDVERHAFDLRRFRGLARGDFLSVVRVVFVLLRLRLPQSV
jgi:hypothetical protein